MRHSQIASLLLCSMFLCCNNISKSSPRAADTKIAIKEPVDSIVIIKNLRQMQVFHHQKLLKVYHVCLGQEPVGAKHFRNDGRTPEGIYHINGKNPNSQYHKALGVSYPSAEDILYASRFGKPTGGDIKIHGLPNGYKGAPNADIKDDWTLGCIALNNEEIDEVYAHVTVGIWVNILP
jgi:murein L,D-transpeptidase YafK